MGCHLEGFNCGGWRRTDWNEGFLFHLLLLRATITFCDSLRLVFRALFGLIAALPSELISKVEALAIDGTSSTALLCDRTTGEVLANPKLYNEAQGKEAVELARNLAPESHTATAGTSTLCKLLTWHLDSVWQQVPSWAWQVPS